MDAIVATLSAEARRRRIIARAAVALSWIGLVVLVATSSDDRDRLMVLVGILLGLVTWLTIASVRAHSRRRRR